MDRQFLPFIVVRIDHLCPINLTVQMTYESVVSVYFLFAFSFVLHVFNDNFLEVCNFLFCAGGDEPAEHQIALLGQVHLLIHNCAC